jgi:hypothetical protein
MIKRDDCLRLWGFNSTLSNVVNIILAKIEGRQYNQSAPNMNNFSPNQISNNINIPQMNPNAIVLI